MAKGDTIIPCQVGAGFSGADEIISGDPIVCMRKANFDHFAAKGFKSFNPLFDLRSDFRVQPFTEAFRGQADFQAANIPIEGCQIIRDRAWDRSPIHGVMAGNDIQQHGGIFDSLCEWPNLVE
ncbi:MAG: hypothetical protein AMXMBFR75_13310 [Candidatus Hinthialibacteria bacterium]